MSAYTSGSASRVSLTRVLPPSPPRVELDNTPLPTDLPIKVLGGGVHSTDGAKLEILARANETHTVTRSFSEMIRGGSMTRKWQVSHLDAVTGSKFVYNLASLALHKKEEDAVYTFFHRSLRTWIREKPLWVPHNTNRRTNRVSWAAVVSSCS